MELQYYGANTIRITTKKAAIVADDNLELLGQKTVTKPQDLQLRTNIHIPLHPSRFMADLPGEYEISEVVIEAIAARAFTDVPDIKTGVIFKITAEDIKVAIMGHIHPNISDEEVEKLGLIDVMFVPVGGNDYTLDGEGALKLIKKIEPKIVIPTHYAEVGIRYEAAQQTLDEAIKALSMEPAETMAKYRPKGHEFSDSTKLIILEKS